MITYDEVHEMLDEIAATLPREFYADLNGGVVLADETKMSDKAGDVELFVLGQYFNHPYGLGRYIVIYYGSFRRLYGRLPKPKQKAELRRILCHEFTHHIESLAGDKTLEIKDKIAIERYKNNNADPESGNRQNPLRRRRNLRRNE